MVLTISVFYLLLSLVELQEINHEVEDEEVMEGDIIVFTKFSNRNNNNTLLNYRDDYGENAPMSDSMPWPDGIIPYEISETFSKDDKKLIRDMMAKIQSVSCVRFEIHHTELTFMEIRYRPNTRCSSSIGYIGRSGPRPMYLHSLCMNEHYVMHELMHALGFFHEHNRIDRDDYVIIHYENIQPTFNESFKKRDFKEHILIGIDYDFNSVTHYPKNANAINPQSPTIESRHGEEIKPDGLTEQDILKINRFYKCSEDRDSLPKDCPHSWFFDKRGFCYKAIYRNSMSWDEANQACVKLKSEASLPIFHSLSEYISYNFLWNQQFSQSCSETSWLGITYNTSTRNFSWTDGSELTFSMLNYGEQPQEGFSIRHYETGSNWQVTKKDIRIVKKVICQLRSRNNRIPHDPIQYPKNSKCPNKENWIFDEDSNICYYFDRQKLNWTSANSYCKNEHNSFLPYFSTVKEYESFRKLLTKLHIGCNEHIWIGYIINGGELLTVNGSIPLFNMYENVWMLSQLPSYTYFSWHHRHSWHQTDTNANALKTFLCQHRNGRKCPQKEHWFYDEYSDICYYYDRHDRRNWTSAFANCKSEVGGSLPYFMTENEFDSFLKLIKTLHISCFDDIWLGYYGKNNSFINVNGSANSFIKWYPYYPELHSSTSFIYFNWYNNAFKNEDRKWEIKSVFCQCRSGNCKTEKTETLPLDQSCPVYWTFDPSYPNICYYNAQYLPLANWYTHANYCYELNPQATLPIFHDLSEYISYSKWVYEYLPSYRCSYVSWLGISYNTTTKNYSWIDGSNVSFNFYVRDIEYDENYTFIHHFYGSNKWIETAKTTTLHQYFALCQLRISKTYKTLSNCANSLEHTQVKNILTFSDKNSLLKTTTTVSLKYPKNRKCPQKENWFYDEYSDICYYYDRHDRRKWTSAFANCKTKVGGSLPYFMTENEFDSFVELIKKLHISCWEHIWLGYYGKNNFFVNVNGSANSFIRWYSGYPELHSSTSFMYFNWDDAFKNEDSKMMTKNVLCQCRSGSCKTEKIAKQYFSNII